MCLLRGVVSHLSLSLPLLCLMKHVQCIYLMHDKPPRLVAGRRPQRVSVRPPPRHHDRQRDRIQPLVTKHYFCKVLHDDGWGERAKSEREREKEAFFL